MVDMAVDMHGFVEINAPQKILWSISILVEDNFK